MDKDSTQAPAVSPIAVAVLELGKKIASGSNKGARPDPSVAISLLKGTAEARRLLTCRDGDPDALEVQCLATAAYLSLMVDYHPNVRYVSEVVGHEEPRDVLMARTAIRSLCQRKALRFQNGGEKIWNGTLALTMQSMGMMGFCIHGSPVFGEKSLGMPAPAQDTDGDAARAEQTKPTAEYIPTAEVLGIRIREKVKGSYLEQPIRTIASMFTTHLYRAAMIRNGKHPGTPNVVGLLIGSSSAGKTFLAETAAKVVNEVCGENTVPFSSFSATDLTQEGYVGCSVEDIVRPLLDQCNWDAAKGRFGCAFTDEIDKKACHTDRNTLDVGGRAVQEGLLRVIGGSTFPVGSRRVSWDQKTAQFNSDGTFFLFGGAFVGLEHLMKRNNGSSLGFGRGQETIHDRPRLRECLVEYGLIPELVSRIGSIIVFPDPLLADLTEILTSKGGLMTCYRRLWEGMGLAVTITADGIGEVAAYGLETASFARGMQSVCNRLTEQLVADGKTDKIRLSVREVRAVIDSMGRDG